ncbi:MFS transporter [Shouchella shacheensis]|uniref:MFS transporter n=1 Tax=Shouchella shacheensis TaxID=1649580 RepID=UPI00074024B5|nr:MFS transporter [Shouchella shacheensis]
MSYIQEGTTTYRHAALALFFAGFVTFATLYTTQPLMPVFSEDFAVSPSSASLTLSLSTGVLAIGLLIATPLSQRYGRKNVMLASMMATSLLSLLSALSPSFGLLLLVRGLLGLALAGVPAIAMTYIVEEFQKRGLGKIMGLYIAGTSIGGMSGRLLTGFLTDLLSWRFAIALISILAIVLTLLFFYLLPAPSHPKNPSLSLKQSIGGYLKAFKDKKLVLLISLGFWLMGSFVTLFNYIGFYLMAPPFSFSQTVIGLLFITYLAGTFSSVYMGKKADQYGKRRVLLLSGAIMAAGAWLTAVPSSLMQLPALLIFTFGFFASHSIASSTVSTQANGARAEASSLYLVAYYLGSSIAGTVGGFFWSSYGWLGVLLFVSGLLLCVVPVLRLAR